MSNAYAVDDEDVLGQFLEQKFATQQVQNNAPLQTAEYDPLAAYMQPSANFNAAPVNAVHTNTIQYQAAQAGSQGVVFGTLTADKKLDKPNLEKLIAASKGMEIVFHMAFDELSDEDQLEAIDWLSQAGVTRILTRAGVSGDSLEKRFAHYHRILEHAKGKIEILPGGGIDLDNRQTFIDQLGVTQLHGTKVVF